MDIEEIIEKTAEKTVKKTIKCLTEKGMIKISGTTAYDKTFKLLKRYNQLRLSDSPDALKKVAQIEVALNQVRENPYFAVIPMYFFENQTLENIADHFNSTVKTIRKKRKDMVDYMSVILFSDDVIMDILS